MPSPETDDLVAWLRQPEVYPDQPEDVECVETHISWVFLTRRYAFKLKKPVRFDFLDYRTPELRRAACEAEVTLNTRLAPDVYLGVQPVAQKPSGAYVLGAGGEVVDYLVKMRRLPEARRLDILIERQEITEDEVQAVAQWLSSFYEQAPPLTLRPEEYLEELDHHVRDNRKVLLDAVAPELASLVRRLSQVQLEVIKLQPELLTDRVRDGRIIDGHGDLRPEHVYLVGPPAVIDCIEFSDEFRTLDVADELCFFAMECDRLGADGLARSVLQHIFRHIGDQPDQRLLRFYKCYRACVRAKVAALRSEQQARSESGDTLRLEEQYLELAEKYVRDEHPPRLIVVCGAMGTGKSTLAAALSEELGIEVLRTDALRRQEFGASEEDPGFEGGVYRPELRDAVYQRLFSQAGELLARGESVLLDGSFLSADHRRAAARLAERSKAGSFLLIHCRCPREVAKGRIAERRREGEDVSEARPELLERQLEEADLPTAAEGALLIDTTESLKAQVQAVLVRLAQPAKENRHTPAELSPLRRRDFDRGESSRDVPRSE